MVIREILSHEKEIYDALVEHPLQSWAWGEARVATGNRIVRLGIFEHEKLKKAWLMTVHQIPKLNRVILYCPKGPMPDAEVTAAIDEYAKDLGAVFVKVEPNVYIEHGTRNMEQENNGQKDIESSLQILNSTPVKTTADRQVQDDKTLETYHSQLVRLGYKRGRTLFTPYNFIIDLTQSEEELMARMKPKTRYNVRLGLRKGVEVREDNSEEAFEKYLELQAQTTSRQGFYAHDAEYHRKVWEKMREGKIAHLLTAVYQDKVLVTWIVFQWKETLYYPYGGWSGEYSEVMANNVMMWEAMRFGKKMGCKQFDLWGTAGLNPKPEDAWYGFHRFKEGYGPQVVQYVGAYDYVIDPLLYPLVTRLDVIRRWLLKVKAFVKPSTFG